MEERDTGYILRIRPFTETSLIVHWLTQSQGRIATIARGARRPKSAFRGKLDLFFRARLSFHRSRRSDLHPLREVVLESSFPELRTDIDRLRHAAYAARLVEKTTESEAPMPEVYALWTGFIGHLAEAPPNPVGLLLFEFGLLHELGLAPDLKSSRLSPGAVALLEQALNLGWSKFTRLKTSPGQLAELQSFLRGLFEEHLGVRLPKPPG